MAISLLNNIASLVAQNELQSTQTKLQSTLFQLSSGSRINSGADDRSGLGHRQRLGSEHHRVDPVDAERQQRRRFAAGGGWRAGANHHVAQSRGYPRDGSSDGHGFVGTTPGAGHRVSTDQHGNRQHRHLDRLQRPAVFASNARNVFLSDGVSNSTISTTTGALSNATLGLVAGTVNVNTPATQATAQISLSGANPVNADTVTFGGTTYKFVTAGTVAANGDVAIGATANQTLVNLANAINDAGGTPGTDYKVAAADANE